MCKVVQKRAKTCKNLQQPATTCNNLQKRASQICLDPIQKCAPASSVQLEAVYLEALLYARILLIVSNNQFEYKT